MTRGIGPSWRVTIGLGAIRQKSERKYAILFAATLLCARKLIELDSDRPSPAKVAVVENAISQAAFIMEHIEKRWPKE
jgi:hypothetical protein